VHVALAAIQGLITCEFKEGLMPVVETIKGFITQAGTMDLVQMVDAIGHFRVHKAFDSNVKKVTFACRLPVECNGTRTCLGSCISRLFVSSGAERKLGKAPMGWMERVLGVYLRQRRQQG